MQMSVSAFKSSCNLILTVARSRVDRVSMLWEQHVRRHEHRHALLDGYARQIDRLEQHPNATPEHDAALEQEFAAVKAQVRIVAATAEPEASAPDLSQWSGQRRLSCHS
jgi:hypothetical protein